MNKKIDFGLKIYVFSFLVHIIMIFLIVFWNDIDFYSINYVFNKKNILLSKIYYMNQKDIFLRKNTYLLYNVIHFLN